MATATQPQTFNLYDPCCEDEAQSIGYEFKPLANGTVQIGCLYNFAEYGEFCTPRIMSKADARKLYKELLAQDWYAR